MTLYVRPLTDEERRKIERLARARTAPVRLVQRAQIIERSSVRQTAAEIAEALAIGHETARHWIRRFNEAGLDGLDDAPRRGRPRTYSEADYSRVIAKARSAPPRPEGTEEAISRHWTLNGLQAALAAEGLTIKRSQIRRLLRAEHIRWQQPRTWLVSDDPHFAEKRGRSSCKRTYAYRI